jgi:hypothetical protein
VTGNGAPIAASPTTGFEIGTTLVPGTIDAETTVQVSIVDRLGTMSEEGVDAALQVRTGTQCWTDGECSVGSVCLRPYHNPSLGQQMPLWYRNQAGACAPPLEPLCSAADNDQGVNESMTTAHNGEPANNNARSCQFDEDWYHFSANSDGHRYVSITNTDTTTATYSLLFMDESGLIYDDGLFTLAPGEESDALQARYVWVERDIKVRVVKLDAGDGSYDLDFSTFAATCNTDAACTSNSQTADAQLTDCFYGTCEPPEGLLFQYTCPLNSNLPDCNHTVPATY